MLGRIPHIVHAFCHAIYSALKEHGCSAPIFHAVFLIILPAFAHASYVGTFDLLALLSLAPLVPLAPWHFVLLAPLVPLVTWHFVLLALWFHRPVGPLAFGHLASSSVIVCFLCLLGLYILAVFRGHFTHAFCHAVLMDFMVQFDSLDLFFSHGRLFTFFSAGVSLVEF